MNDLITKARELCEKATPGPWVSLHGIPNPSVCQDRDWDKEIAVVHGSNDYGGYRYHQAVADADLMAASSTLVPQLCDALEEAEAENRWIPVRERLPKKPPDYFKDGHWWMVSGEDFIVVDSDGKVYEAHWTYGCSCQNYFWYVNSLTPLTNITHWRPLPEPPKGELAWSESRLT